MVKKENARADVAAPTRAAEEKPLTGDLRPQNEHTTLTDAAQVKSAWSFEDEARLVDYIILPFIRPGRRKLSEYLRRLIYEDAKREINRYPFSAEANQYARQRLAEGLRL